MNEPINSRADEMAAAESFNNTFHKVRAEVSMDWWQKIWAKAVAWERAGSDDSANRMAYEGAREDLLEWKRRALEAEQLLRQEVVMWGDVVAWVNAESARIAAVNHYNEALEAAKKFDFGSVDLTPHYQKMTLSANIAHRLLAPMHTALVSGRERRSEAG